MQSADGSDGSRTEVVDAFEPGAELPPVDSVAAAVFMGGPMSTGDAGSHPQLAAEIGWLGHALDAELPVLGVCLGAQLIARALGGDVRPASAKEIGWASIDVSDATDPLLGALAPSRTVLHWHGEEFDTPPGARGVASTPAHAWRSSRV